MGKIKELFNKYREIILYLVFGVITTIVSFGVFYTVILTSTYVFGALDGGKDSIQYLIWNAVANILKWCAGVLVAFYTNKKWVFTKADKNVSTAKQLLVFAEGRVVTLILAMILQYLLELLFAAVITQGMTIFGMDFSAELIGTTAALIIYSVIEVIANYFFSKIFVFKNKK